MFLSTVGARAYPVPQPAGSILVPGMREGGWGLRAGWRYWCMQTIQHWRLGGTQGDRTSLLDVLCEYELERSSGV